jgi:hypothetical protein
MTTKTNTYVQLPKVMNTVELEQRKAEAKDRCLNGYYKTTQFSGYYCHPAAAETQSFNNPISFLQYVSSQAKAGIEIYPHIEPIMNGAFFQIAYYLPPLELQALVDQAETEAAEAYTAEIESFNQAQTDLLTNQLVEAELRKEQKKADDHLASIRAKAAATAQAHIAGQLKEVV